MRVQILFRRALSVAITALICNACATTAGRATDEAAGPVWTDGVRALFPTRELEVYVTTADGARLFARDATAALTDERPGRSASPLTVDDAIRFQTIDGFGAELTGSAAHVIAGLPDHGTSVLQAMFDDRAGAGLSYVRMTIAASDFSLGSYSYDDVAPGASDRPLENFDVSRDEEVFGVARSIVATSSDVRYMASPWSAPGWMKQSGKLYGGELQKQDFAAYAEYLVRYLRALRERGIAVDAISPQNEPMLESGQYPTMSLPASAEAAFVWSALGPALRASFPATKILVSDHNWNSVGYASAILADARASQYVSGTAFHCYGGEVADMTRLERSFPDKNITISECSGGAWSPDFGKNLRWDMQNLIIGGTRNWARSVVLGNLALDEADGPTNGGCYDCRGVVTIGQGGRVTRNVEYYVLEHAAKFVRPGAVRIASSSSLGDDLPNVAFRNRDGSTVVLVLNAARRPLRFVVNVDDRWLWYGLPAGAVATIRWR